MKNEQKNSRRSVNQAGLNTTKSNLIKNPNASILGLSKNELSPSKKLGDVSNYNTYSDNSRIFQNNSNNKPTLYQINDESSFLQKYK